MSPRARRARPEVLLDARELAGDSARGGVGTYVRELLGALGADGEVSVAALALDGTDLPAGVARVPIRRSQAGGRRAVIEHASRVAVDVRRARPGLFHNPLFHAPAGLPRPWIQTLFDVIPLVDPDPGLEVLRRRWRRFGPRYRRAEAVIAISEHAAAEGARLLGLDPDRIRVAHLGVGEAFSPLGPGGETAAEPYVLVVSQFSARKGFGDAFEVIAAVAEAGLDHHLEVVGWVPPDRRAELDALLARARRPDRVRLAGFVDDLPSVMRRASLLLVPSRYEGFGLPALEAMASGVPVISYANSSLIEVVGDGGVLVPDGDVAAMARAAVGLLGDGPARAAQVARGREWAAGFTWARTAATTAAVYREVLGR